MKIRRTKDKKARWEVYSNHMVEFEQQAPAGTADYTAWSDGKGKKANSHASNHPQVTEVKEHVENDERVNIVLHLTK